MTARTLPHATHGGLGSPAAGRPSTRRAARFAGVSYVALFALAFFANFFVRERLVVGGDAAATFSNIAEAKRLACCGERITRERTFALGAWGCTKIKSTTNVVQKS